VANLRRHDAAGHHWRSDLSDCAHLFHTVDILIAMAFGLTILGLVILLRRLSLGRWTAVTACAAAFAACGGVALRFAANPAVTPPFRFTKLESAETGAAGLRALSDANWQAARSEAIKRSLRFIVTW
jgi:hypothetical protein